MRYLRHGLTTGLIVVLAGCVSNAHLRDRAAGPDRDLTAGYSLLYAVVADESRVAGLFLLRQPGPAVRATVEAIAAAAGSMKADLEAFARQAEHVQFDAASLPAVEADVRGIIEARQRGRLMFGDQFDRDLLLTQAEATQYMAALARRLSELEPDAARSARLGAFARQMTDLHDRVTDQLHVIEPEP